jgi:hypothetical protein
VSAVTSDKLGSLLVSLKQRKHGGQMRIKFGTQNKTETKIEQLSVQDVPGLNHERILIMPIVSISAM